MSKYIWDSIKYTWDTGSNIVSGAVNYFYPEEEPATKQQNTQEQDSTEAGKETETTGESEPTEEPEPVIETEPEPARENNPDAEDQQAETLDTPATSTTDSTEQEVTTELSTSQEQDSTEAGKETETTGESEAARESGPKAARKDNPATETEDQQAETLDTPATSAATELITLQEQDTTEEGRETETAGELEPAEEPETAIESVPEPAEEPETARESGPEPLEEPEPAREGQTQEAIETEIAEDHPTPTAQNIIEPIYRGLKERILLESLSEERLNSRAQEIINDENNNLDPEHDLEYARTLAQQEAIEYATTKTSDTKYYLESINNILDTYRIDYGGTSFWAASRVFMAPLSMAAAANITYNEELRREILSIPETWELIFTKGDDAINLIDNNQGIIARIINSNTSLDSNLETEESHVITEDVLPFVKNIIAAASTQPKEFGNLAGAIISNITRNNEEGLPISNLVENIFDITEKNQQFRQALTSDENLSHISNIIIRAYDKQPALRQKLQNIPRDLFVDTQTLLKNLIKEGIENPQNKQEILQIVRDITDNSNRAGHNRSTNQALERGSRSSRTSLQENTAEQIDLDAHGEEFFRPRIPLIKILTEEGLSNPESRTTLFSTVRKIMEPKQYLNDPENKKNMTPQEENDLLNRRYQENLEYIRALFENCETIFRNPNLREKLNTPQHRRELAEVILTPLNMHGIISHVISPEILGNSNELGAELIGSFIRKPEQIGRLAKVAMRDDFEGLSKNIFDIFAQDPTLQMNLLEKSDRQLNPNTELEHLVSDILTNTIFKKTKKDAPGESQEEIDEYNKTSKRYMDFATPLIMRLVKNATAANEHLPENNGNLSKNDDKILKTADTSPEGQQLVHVFRNLDEYLDQAYYLDVVEKSEKLQNRMTFKNSTEGIPSKEDVILEKNQTKDTLENFIGNAIGLILTPEQRSIIEEEIPQQIRIHRQFLEEKLDTIFDENRQQLGGIRSTQILDLMEDSQAVEKVVKLGDAIYNKQGKWQIFKKGVSLYIHSRKAKKIAHSWLKSKIFGTNTRNSTNISKESETAIFKDKIKLERKSRRTSRNTRISGIGIS